MKCSFQQNTRKFVVSVKNLSDKNTFLFLFFIFRDTFLVPMFQCYHFQSEHHPGFCLTGLITLRLLVWKMMGLFMRKNHVLTLSAPISQNGQTHSKQFVSNLLTNCLNVFDHFVGLVLKGLKCWGWLSLQSWIGAFTLYLLLKLSPRKLEPWFILWSFMRLLCISINLPFGHAWNTVAMPGLMSFDATWIVRKATKTDMQDYWSFTCCLFWTLGSSSNCSSLKSFLQVFLW